MNDTDRRAKILRQYLFTERSFGVDEIPQEHWAQVSKSLGLDVTPEEKGWESLKKRALECTQCQLCEKRTQVVFGEGNPNADLMFIGEGPGYDEDIQGTQGLAPKGSKQGSNA